MKKSQKIFLMIAAFLLQSFAEASHNFSEDANLLEDKVMPALNNAIKVDTNASPSKLTIEHGYNKSSEEVMSSKDSKDNNRKILTSNKLKSLSLSVESVDSHDFHKMLEEAVNANKQGQIEAATSIYEQLLIMNPDNNDVLFGLATIYHSLELLEEARKLYVKILSADPTNKNALNNFLALIGEEEPIKAIAELRKLEALTPNMSIIPAQIAMVYLKNNDQEKAIRYLNKAALLSPNNLTYRYNLAILYDKAGSFDNAIKLYQYLINESYKGSVLPDSSERINQRLTYLMRK